MIFSYNGRYRLYGERMKNVAKFAAGSVLAAAFFASVESTAWAQSDAQQCAAAAEQAQAARDEGKYRRAREQLFLCSRDVCPGAIKKDCVEWLGQIDSLAPTVVFGAKGATGDVTDVKVQMDGVTLTERLDGKPVAVDTGEHTFKFERNGAVKEEKVLIGAGQKGRTISVSFAPVVVAMTTERPVPVTTHKEDVSDQSRMIPVYVLGGVGVIGLASFAFFGLSGRSDVSDLEKSCKPNCAQSDVDHAHTKLLVADISLGVGVVSLGVAAYLFFTRPRTETPSAVSGVTFDAGPLAGGAAARFFGRF